MFRTYTTKEGDRWDTVAADAYGDVSKIDTLIQANPGMIVFDAFPHGLTLRVPVLEPADLIDPEILPEWKR